jgi:glycosyltransferase involved in cell wall biosynthesis
VSARRVPARLEAAFWEKTGFLRRQLRALLGLFARRRQRRRGLAVAEPREKELPPLSWPAVGPEDPAPYLAVPGDPPPDSPPETFEALLLVAAAEDLDLVEAGWAEPSPVAGLPPAEIVPFAGGAWLLRRPGAAAANLAGKVLPLLGGKSAADGPTEAWPFFRKSGAYRFPPAAKGGRTFTTRVDLRLAAMPPLEGPPTVLFLLPYLAIGGAERLLFDLLGAWGGYRVLIVTLDPHLATLGQNVGPARGFTPHVFTLGDWLPRETHLGALFHLLRRYQVKTLVSWNGTTFFYDALPAIRERFPELRILAQLYHHEGAYFARNGPAARAIIDGHLAVNRAIEAALASDLGLPSEKIFLLHHGVELPPEAAAAEREAERQLLREQLGLPREGVVLGTFIRLHPQKRPFDILALARLFAGRPVCFLLVGGGPLEAELEAELEARPLPNLLRLPMVADARRLYPAVDICLMTSAYEGLPIFLLDGLARGIPCVATAVGEIPELLAEGGGACAPVGDLDALAAAIEGLMGDEERRRQGELGRRAIAERFSLEVFAAAYRRAIFPGPADAAH